MNADSSRPDEPEMIRGSNETAAVLKAGRVSWTGAGVAIWLMLAAWGRGAEQSDAPGPASGATNASPTGVSSELGASPKTLKASLINSMEALDEKHKLAIGDRLSFRILEDEEESKPLLVTDSGELELPYIGRFPAAGRNCKELAQAVKVELEKEYYFHATVIVAVDVMTKSRGRVYLNGAVRTTGPQEIPSDEVLTVGKAISRAGGFGEFANKKQVKITRKPAQPGGEERTYFVNGVDILEKGKTDCDLALEPDDMIFVPERGFHFR
ncbi:MAG: polysaccharide biosynthesis/export family protein [Limisphaerales bacterium]